MPVYMPWGKHRGKPVDELPVSYVVWVLTECDNVSSYLEEALFLRVKEWLEEEIGRIEADSSNNRKPADVIASWFRQMSREFHPDRGGTNDGMRAINRGYELLQQLFGK